MLYKFAPAIEAGITAGKYEQVISKPGIPLGIARHAIGPQSGQFVAHAIGISELDPLTVVPHLTKLTANSQMTLTAVNALSSSVAVLQATTAVIGVGVVVTGVLSAVNLWQTIKLRQDVRTMRLEVQEGFLNLHQALIDQGEELIEHIDRVAADVEFRNHRTILVRAYSKFQKALSRLQTASRLQDSNQRNDEITASRSMLFDALADYDNEYLMEGICSAAYLRRRECVWAIEQSIAMTYQLQGELSAVSDRLICLDQMLRRDVVKVVSDVSNFEELEFLFPEVLRIHDHDLAAINIWKEHINWYQELDSQEVQNLKTLPPVDEQLTPELNLELLKPPEYEYWEEVEKKSHPCALQDSLLILMDDNQRQNHQNYILERSKVEGLSALNEENLQQASPITLANLNYYFLMRDESLEEDDE